MLPLLAFLDHVPALVKFGCEVLALVWLTFISWMFVSGMRVKHHLKSVADLCNSFGTKTERLHAGLDLLTLDKLRTDYESRGGAAGECWRQLDDHFELYVAPDESESYFLTVPAREVLTYDNLVTSRHYGAFFAVIPGIITGGGLAVTFAAILQALYDVHYDKANTVNPITGIDTLINGLSGKFLSSILAIILAIVFTFVERWISRSIKRQYDLAIARLTRAVPYLSPSRILLDIHRFSSQQAVSLSNLSSELVDRLTNTLNTEVLPGLAEGMSAGVAVSMQAEFRPTLERMTASLDGLQTAIVQIESQKGESVTGEFAKMADAIEKSISQSLNKMGEQFRSALVGTAQNEFTQAQNSLETTRLVLEQVASQFKEMQDSFKAIASRAEQSTSQQLESGRAQTEAINTVMHGLLAKLQEVTDQNMNSLRFELSTAVSDLTTKVSGLSQELMTTSKMVAERSEQNIASVIEQTEGWSKASTARMEALLVNIEKRAADFRDAGASLQEAKSFMIDLLKQNSTALSEMAAAGRQVQTYTLALTQHTEGLRSIRDGHVAVTSNLRETAAGLSVASQRHEQLLQDYNNSISQFAKVFESLDGSIARIMSATNTGLSAYNQSVEQNFDRIVDVADKLVPKAANLLNTQIDELTGQLEELSGVINKFVGATRGRTA